MKTKALNTPQNVPVKYYKTSALVDIIGLIFGYALPKAMQKIASLLGRAEEGKNASLGKSKRVAEQALSKKEINSVIKAARKLSEEDLTRMTMAALDEEEPYVEEVSEVIDVVQLRRTEEEKTVNDAHERYGEIQNAMATFVDAQSALTEAEANYNHLNGVYQAYNRAVTSLATFLESDQGQKLLRTRKTQKKGLIGSLKIGTFNVLSGGKLQTELTTLQDVYDGAKQAIQDARANLLQTFGMADTPISEATIANIKGRLARKRSEVSSAKGGVSEANIELTKQLHLANQQLSNLLGLQTRDETALLDLYTSLKNQIEKVLS